jgi:hypothetical protein
MNRGFKKKAKHLLNIAIVLSLGQYAFVGFDKQKKNHFWGLN